MKGELLGGVGEEGYFVDLLALLVDGFDNLHVNSITFPGHQG